MPSIQRFAVRSSGRDLSLVRRPVKYNPRRAVVVEPVAVEAVELDPAELKKDDLANLAVAVGADPSGTKPEVLKRVKKATDG